MQIPKFGDGAAETFEAVLRGNLRFPSKIFRSVSPEAKDLLRKMIYRDPSRRLSAEQVLSQYSSLSTFLYIISHNLRLIFILIANSSASMDRKRRRDVRFELYRETVVAETDE